MELQDGKDHKKEGVGERQKQKVPQPETVQLTGLNLFTQEPETGPKEQHGQRDSIDAIQTQQAGSANFGVEQELQARELPDHPVGEIMRHALP